MAEKVRKIFCEFPVSFHEIPVKRIRIDKLNQKLKGCTSKASRPIFFSVLLCSYNNMAHVINQNQYFLFRTKDIHSKGLIRNFDFPDEDSFDIRVNVCLVRTHSKKALPDPVGYVRFINQASTFDFIKYGSWETYGMDFHIVRFPLSDSTYECIVTNLPEDEFPPKRIKETYYSRWG